MDAARCGARTPIDRARQGLGINSRRVGCSVHSSANVDGSGFEFLNPSVPADSRPSRGRAADHGPNHVFMARPAPFLPFEMTRLTELSPEGKGGLSVDRGSVCVFTTGRCLSSQTASLWVVPFSPPGRTTCALLVSWT